MLRALRPLVVANLFALITSGCFATAPSAPGFPAGGTRILFVGNSLTYVNDLPGMLDAVARQVGNTQLHVASIAFPDFALEDHWTEGSARRALTDQRWEYVVMQQGSSALPASQVHLRTWAAQFAPLIRAAGATPVMYMVWPTTSRLGDFPGVLESYRTAAAAINGIFAPAGDAWTASGNLGLLYSADGLHPTIQGTYLSAIVLLERMTGIRPEQLPPSIPGVDISAEQVRALQRAARVALDRNPARATTTVPIP